MANVYSIFIFIFIFIAILLLLIITHPILILLSTYKTTIIHKAKTNLNLKTFAQTIVLNYLLSQLPKLRTLLSLIITEHPILIPTLNLINIWFSPNHGNITDWITTYILEQILTHLTSLNSTTTKVQSLATDLILHSLEIKRLNTKIWILNTINILFTNLNIKTLTPYKTQLQSLTTILILHGYVVQPLNTKFLVPELENFVFVHIITIESLKSCRDLQILMIKMIYHVAKIEASTTYSLVSYSINVLLVICPLRFRSSIKILLSGGELIVVRHLVILVIVYFVGECRSGGSSILVLVFVAVLRFECTDLSSMKVRQVLDEVTKYVLDIKEVTIWSVVVVPGSLVLGAHFPELEGSIATAVQLSGLVETDEAIRQQNAEYKTKSIDYQ